MSRNGKNPDGDGFTDETIQAHLIKWGRVADADITGDAEEMRRRFDIPRFQPEEWVPREGAAISGVYPDMLIHVEEPSDGPSTVNGPGASFTLVEAPKGSGKSTAADQFGIYQMEHNDERVIRNGRQQTSEWRRCADWATLWLPSGVDIDGRWMVAVDRDEPDPEELVRHVKYYDDVFDLIDQLQQHPKGTYNVVYPDPYFRGCEDAVGRADTTVKQPKFSPKNESNPTPASHWWFAFIAARTFDGYRVDADGERNWMTLHIDEFGMLAPESASGGESGHWTYELIQIMSEATKEARKAGLSVVGYAHHEEDVHNKWLKEFDYWVELSNHERGNRINKSEAPKPFRDLEQNTDFLSSRPRGYGLCYTGSRFSEFQFTDLGYPMDMPEFQLRLGVPESVTVTTSDGRMRVDDIRVARDDNGQPTFLEEYRAAGGEVHELRVRSPGSGIIDISGDEPTVVEDLVSPYPDGSFPRAPIDESPESYDVIFRRDDDRELVAARIPRASGPDAGGQTEVIADD